MTTWKPDDTIRHRRTGVEGVIKEIHLRTAWVCFGGTEAIPVPVGSMDYEVVR